LAALERLITDRAGETEATKGYLWKKNPVEFTHPIFLEHGGAISEMAFNCGGNGIVGLSRRWEVIKITRCLKIPNRRKELSRQERWHQFSKMMPERKKTSSILTNGGGKKRSDESEALRAAFVIWEKDSPFKDSHLIYGRKGHQRKAQDHS